MRSKYIDKNTVDKLRRSMVNEEWLPLRISLETGLRIGDVVSLKRTALKRKDGSYFLRTAAQKTGKLGDFPISDSLAEVLKVRKGTYIFPSYGKSGHLTRQAAWSRMKSAAHRLGINADGISPHSLRKCFAVALRHQAGIEAVKKALQHSSSAVTRVYAYADTVLQFDSDEPIRWRDVELIVDYILERLREN